MTETPPRPRPPQPTSVAPSSLAIVVPALNEAANIGATLASLAPIRGRGRLVVVVDGGSTDGTAACCAGAADVVAPGPRGRARQMNHGAALVTSADVLLFVHADSRLPADADRHVLDAIASGAEWGRFDVTIAGRSAWLRVVAATMNLRSRLSGIATGDQAIFVRADVLRAVGGFPDQPLMEDVELSRRLRARSRPACLRQRVVTSGRRWETRGVWPTIWLMWRLRWRYWRGEPAESLARAYR